ncbi:MAG: HD domain-containing protein [Lachnospiraceae bacterium]|nr:HD domain-containing protein [Lachnospiraceae bacterium]
MIYIEDFREGDRISGVYLCKTKVNAKTKTGKSYYSLTLQDRTGLVDAKIWDLSSGIDHFEAMDYIHVEGEATVFQGAIQANIRRVRRAHEGEYDPADYLPTSPYSEEDMFKKVLFFIGTVKNEYLRTLLEKFFVEDREFAAAFRKHSAAKSVHHSFVGGLLQHTVRVTEMCEFYCQRYLMLQRDLLITGALLHDIGKLKEISAFPANDYTDDGNLLGHIAMGFEMVMEKGRQIPGFPPKLLSELGHMILSHHGELEYGSPKKPALIEALALHLADNTDAKLQSMSEILDRAVEGDAWLGNQRLFDTNIRRTTDPSRL